MVPQGDTTLVHPLLRQREWNQYKMAEVSVPAVKTKHVEDGCGAPPAAKERNKYKVAAIPSSTTSKNSKVAVVETLNVA